MTTTSQQTSVSTTTHTSADPATAFDVFTARIGTWWSPDHHVLGGTIAAMHVDPHVGGGLWDENTDGETCTWGRVLTWDPPRVFAFAWLVGTDWQVMADESRASRVTVTFTLDDGGTRVELVHDRLDAHGEGWEGMREGVGGPGGWPQGLGRFAAAADQAAAGAGA